MPTLTTYYPVIKDFHTHVAMLSISVFLLRWVLLLLRVPFAKAKLLRIAPHIIDSLLLLSAITLCVVLQQYPLQQAWLSAKITYLLAYIGCGMLALRHAPSQKVRLLMGLLSIALFAQIVVTAITKQPLGLLSLVG